MPEFRRKPVPVRAELCKESGEFEGVRYSTGDFLVRYHDSRLEAVPGDRFRAEYDAVDREGADILAGREPEDGPQAMSPPPVPDSGSSQTRAFVTRSDEPRPSPTTPGQGGPTAGLAFGPAGARHVPPQLPPVAGLRMASTVAAPTPPNPQTPLTPQAVAGHNLGNVPRPTSAPAPAPTATAIPISGPLPGQVPAVPAAVGDPSTGPLPMAHTQGATFDPNLIDPSAYPEAVPVTPTPAPAPAPEEPPHAP